MSHINFSVKEEIINAFIDNIKKEIENINKELEHNKQEFQYHKGAMESRYDTFKEEAEHLWEAYENRKKEYNQKIQDLLKVKSLLVIKPTSIVCLEEINKEENQNNKKEKKWYYLLPIGGYKYSYNNEMEIISLTTESPLGKLLLNKKTGEIIEFNGKKYKITEII
jgi:ribosome-binding ATPase YchF (GTP1/OBG family)